MLMTGMLILEFSKNSFFLSILSKQKVYSVVVGDVGRIVCRGTIYRPIHASTKKLCMGKR